MNSKIAPFVEQLKSLSFKDKIEVMAHAFGSGYEEYLKTGEIVFHTNIKFDSSSNTWKEMNKEDHQEPEDMLDL